MCVFWCVLRVEDQRCTVFLYNIIIQDPGSRIQVPTLEKNFMEILLQNQKGIRTHDQREIELKDGKFN